MTKKLAELAIWHMFYAVWQIQLHCLTVLMILMERSAPVWKPP